MSEALTAEQLNQAIAREVFGWRWSTAWSGLIPPEQTATPVEMWEDSEFGRIAAPGKAVPGVHYNGDLNRIHIPDFCRDMGEAFSILVRLTQEAAPQLLWDAANHGWICEIRTASHFGQCFDARPCIAIVIAALRFEGAL